MALVTSAPFVVSSRTGRDYCGRGYRNAGNRSVVSPLGGSGLRALETNGRIEAARIQNVGGLDALFADIAGRVERACAQVGELQALAAEGAAHGLPVARARLGHHLARLHAVGADAGARAAA